MPTRYAYLAGMPHSGTTLLSILLSAHPQVATLGGTQVVPRLLGRALRTGSGICSCGHTFAEDPFWAGVRHRMEAAGVALDGEYFARGDGDDRDAAAKQRSTLVAAVMAETGADVFLDGSKRPDFLAPLMTHQDFDLSVVDWYRDGRGVMASWKRAQPDESFRDLAEMWVRRENLRRDMVARIPAERRMEARYEDLCRDPSQTLSTIAAFLGVDPDVDLMGRMGTEHHVLGNQMRLEPVTEIRHDERWRRELDDDDLAVFAEVGGEEINRRNGYGG